MKKVLIIGLIVIVGAVTICFGYGYESSRVANAKETVSTNQNTITSNIINNSNNSNTQSHQNTNNNTNSNEINNTSDNTSNNVNINTNNNESEQNNSTLSRENSDSNNNYSTELDNANAVNLPVVTSLNSDEGYYKSQIENLITETNQINNSNPEQSDAQMLNASQKITKLWANLNQSMINTIESKLSGSQKSIFSQEIGLINNLTKSELNESQGIEQSQGWGSIDGILNSNQVAMLTQQEAFTLFNVFIADNGINPISNLRNDENSLNINQKQIMNMPESYRAVLNNNLAIIENTVSESNNIMNDTEKYHRPINASYKEINTLWINAVDTIYNNMKNVSPSNYDSGSTPYEFDNFWLDYKNSMLNMASNMYSNPQQSELARYRMSIKLTQIECYMLIYQFA